MEGCQTQKTQVDHGYSWVVLGSCFLMRLLFEGFWSVLGMLMIEWETYFKVSASQTAWTATVFLLITYMISPVSSAFGRHLTYRFTVIVAGIIATVGLFAASWVTQFWHLYLIMATLGISMGIVMQTSSSYYILYFNKRFAFANGLFSVAPALAFFVFPPFIDSLFTCFGLRGTLQILSAIMAHICACGALLRTPSKCIALEKMQPDHSGDHRPSNFDMDANDRNDHHILRDIVKDFDLALFRSVRFIFQSVINGILYGGFISSSLIYMVPYSVSVGITDIKAPLLLSTTAICSLVIRVIPFGVLVDRGILSATTLTVVGFSIAGIATIIMTWMETFPGLVIIAAFYGIGTGIGGTFLILVVAYSGGSKGNSSGAIAWTLLGRGLGCFIGVYGGGVLRDKFDSYQPSLILGGVFGLGLAINVLSDPLIQRWNPRWKNKSNARVRRKSVVEHRISLASGSVHVSPSGIWDNL